MENYSEGSSLCGILVEIRYRHLLDKAFILQERQAKREQPSTLSSMFMKRLHTCCGHPLSTGTAKPLLSQHVLAKKAPLPPPPSPWPHHRPSLKNAASLDPGILMGPENKARQVFWLERSSHSESFLIPRCVSAVHLETFHIAPIPRLSGAFTRGVEGALWLLTLGVCQGGIGNQHWS